MKNPNIRYTSNCPEKIINQLLMHRHLNIEDIIREVLSKICSLHGKHPNIEIGKDYRLSISACCQEFHGQLEDIIKDYQLRIERAVS